MTQREQAVENAVHTIIHCWDEWDAYASQEAQQSQDTEAWFDAMQTQLAAVIEGAIGEATHLAPNAGRG